MPSIAYRSELVPFVIGFESHLPRVFGREDWKIFAVLSKMLAAKRCQKIVAISQIARRHFLQQHTGKPWFDHVASKLTVRYPNILIPPQSDCLAASQTEAIRVATHELDMPVCREGSASKTAENPAKLV
jgi:hypothetical protein